jgi:tetratricopeptide (TPR) repeat protein
LEIGAHDADSYFWLAQVKLAGNETAEGVDLLERALELNPNHLPARVRLMYAQLATNQFNALADTLRHLQRMGAVDWVCVAQICLALKQCSFSEAFKHLANLFALPFAEDRAILNAVRELKENGAAAALEPLLCQQLARNTPKSIFGPLWIEVCLKQGRLPRARKIFKRCPSPELRRRVIQSWLDGLHSVPEKKFPANRLARFTFRSDLRRFEKSDRDWFRTNPAAWSSFGAVLIVLRCYRPASRWFADWKQRKSLPRWSLFNIMNTLVSQRRYSEALEAGTRALAQPATARGAETALMLAWLEANRGQADQAQQRIAGMDPSQLQPLWRIVLEIVQATVRSGCASAAQKRAVARAESNKLRSSRDWRGMSHWQLCFRRMFKQSFGLLAANGAGWGARLWAHRVAWRWPWTRGG